MENDFKKILVDNNYRFINYLFFEPDNGRLVAKILINGEETLIKFYKKVFDRIKRVKTEIAVDQAINNFNAKSENKISKTDLILNGDNEKYIWVVRRFYFGKSLSNPLGSKLNQLYNHDIIREDFVKKYRSIIDDIFLNIKLFHQLSEYFNNGMIELDKNLRFIDRISEVAVEKTKSDFGIDLERQRNFLEKIKNSHLSSRHKVSCLGDLIPSNILICDDGKIRLSDFELLCFDNYMLDFSYFWLFLWRQTKWQNYWLAKAVKNKIDQENFRACLIRQVISLISWFEGDKQRNDGHIWLRYLQAAGESFEAITKVK